MKQLKLSLAAASVVLLAASLLFALTVSAAPLQQSNPGTTNMVGCWSLDESSGSRADSGPNGLTLTDNNTVASTTGVVGNAGDFVYANSEYLSRASEAALQAGDIDFTLVIWFKPVSNTNTSYLISKDNNGANREFAIHHVANFGARFIVGGIAVDSTTAFTLNQWYLVIAWHDAAANIIYISINDGTADSTTSVTAHSVGSAPFQVGGRTTGTARYLNGALDEVIYYKRILTSGERTYLYNSGAGRSCASLTSPTATPTATNTSTPTYTITPTHTATSTETATPTYTPTITNTPTVTFTPSNTPTPTNTPTSTPTLNISEFGTLPVDGSGYEIRRVVTYGELGVFSGLIAVCLLLAVLIWLIMRPRRKPDASSV